MFQVLVKTTATMVSAYTYILEDRQAAVEFVMRPDVWWYHYPSEHEDWDWRRGGAWKPAHQVTQDDLEAVPHAPSYGPQQGAVVVSEGEDGDDERW